ncbi:MAG TPA: acetyltransferase [Sphingomicrobium sp.]|nr:acetyltransferase [Sphingomicrobium sp.]
MNVRRGTPADLPRALEIWRSAVDATHGFLSPADRTEIEDLVGERFLPNADLWIAVDDADQPMGFLAMEGSKIEALFVDSAAHGCGYGSLLLDHALLLEPHLSVDANEQASNALAFYLARGFRIVGRSPTDDHGRPYALVRLER